MSTRQINIPDFCAHVADELLAVEQGDTVVALIRNGRTAAYVTPAPQAKGSTGTLADWERTGSGFDLAPGCSLDDPAWSPEEWEDGQDPEAPIPSPTR